MTLPALSLPEASTILVADDDQTFLQVLARSLRKRGFEAITADSVTRASSLQQKHKPEGAVVDLKMGCQSGLALIPELLNFNPHIHIVVLTGYASIATAVEAIKLGAKDYLCKPADTRQILNAMGIKSNVTEEKPEVPPTPMSFNQLEWEHLQKALQENDGNISATARSLGMHRRTLQRKLNKKPGYR